MRLLVLDTTGPACCVALREPGQADIVCVEEMARGQAERLAPMVEEVLAEAGLNPRDLDRIGVTTGPGSFAGTRVGVAFARGLALATGADVVGISNLAWWVNKKARQHAGIVISTHDARRGDVVLQSFRQGIALSEPETFDTAAARENVRAIATRDAPDTVMMLVGSALPILDRGEDSGRWPESDLTTLLDRAEQAMPPFDLPKPFYARPPDAKLPGGRDVT